MASESESVGDLVPVLFKYCNHAKKKMMPRGINKTTLAASFRCRLGKIPYLTMTTCIFLDVDLARYLISS